MALMLLLSISLLAACGGSREVVREAPTQPPVSEQSTSLREPDSPMRTVVAGDTLYSIAWEAGRDYQEVASWNGINPPYTIRIGQQIRVIPPSPSEKSASTPAAPQAARKPTATAKKEKTTNKPPQTVAKRAPAPVEKRSSAVGVSRKPAGKSGNDVGSWSWPAEGQVLSRQSGSGHKGLDIAGATGTAVRAAANGRVVYQGSGLRGYGQLIIVKHNQEFLSAYAHNDRIHVKEGDVVRRGQKIAEMGSTGTDRVKLHFEIRRQGVPIDPLLFLPKR